MFPFRILNPKSQVTSPMSIKPPLFHLITQVLPSLTSSISSSTCVLKFLLLHIIWTLTFPPGAGTEVLAEAMLRPDHSYWSGGGEKYRGRSWEGWALWCKHLHWVKLLQLLQTRRLLSWDKGKRVLLPVYRAQGNLGKILRLSVQMAPSHLECPFHFHQGHNFDRGDLLRLCLPSSSQHCHPFK